MEYRPGFGGSTTVELDKRVQTWLEIVPAVLDKLQVEKVALMSHSAGTIYAFNTAVRLPHLLYPGGKAFMACLGMLYSLLSILRFLSVPPFLFSPSFFISKTTSEAID
jgi:pimeloyl-ACP methyl ester carboxylesterase